MPPIQIDETYLTGQFDEFYREVIRQVRYIQSYRDSLAPPEPEGEDGGNERRNAVEAIRSQLLGILEKQAIDAGKRGGEYGIRFYQEAQYVMAALADEIFLHMEWEGKDLWKTRLLEFALFGTHVAGDLFFQRLEKLLKDRNAAYTGMAAIFHLALSLGFRGKYRDKDDKGKLEFYRRQLFVFIFSKNPDLDSESRRLFPEAYAHTMDQAPGKRFPHLGRWLGLIAGIIVIYLISSHLLWNRLTTDMVDLMENFIR